MPSIDTTFSPHEAHYRVPLRRVYLLEGLASEIHNHNVSKRCVVDFLRKNESLRSAVWQAEQTVTMLRQQLSSRDDPMVGKIRLEYDVSAFAPFYGSPTENITTSKASHRQYGQKRKIIHENLRLNVKRRKRVINPTPSDVAINNGVMDGMMPGSPAVQVAFDLMDLSNSCKEGEQGEQGE